MSYYLKCSRCGRVVSSAIPGGAERVTLRAFVECPECLAAQPDVEQRIAAAVAAERERCAAIAHAYKGRSVPSEKREWNDQAHAYYDGKAVAADDIYWRILARAGEKVEVVR